MNSWQSPGIKQRTSHISSFTTETPDTVEHAAILCINLTSFSILLSRVHRPHRCTSSDSTQHLDFDFFHREETLFINTLLVTLTPKRKGFIIYTTIQPHSVYHFMLTLPPFPSHTHTFSGQGYQIWCMVSWNWCIRWHWWGIPLVVFDSTMDNTVVLSPMNSFMSANQITFTDDQTGDKVLTFGPISSVNEVIMRESLIWFITHPLL